MIYKANDRFDFHFFFSETMIKIKDIYRLMKLLRVPYKVKAEWYSMITFTHAIMLLKIVTFIHI